MRMLLVLLFLSYGQAQRSVGSAQQRAEIEKLRSELNEAFEVGEEQLAHGVIVQPKWTELLTPHKATVSKVVVNEKKLSETAALRSEIKQAVDSDSFVPAARSNVQDMRNLQKTLLEQPNANTPAPSVGSAIVGSASVGSTSAALDKTQPNVVDSTATDEDIDLMQLQRLELSKRRTREMLVLTRIVEDLTFTLGADVEQWLYVQHNGSSYFVGRRQSDLLLLQHDKNSTEAYKMRQLLPMPEPITHMLAYERWNSVTELQEGLILVAMQSQLLWYRIEANASNFEHAWSWHLGSSVSNIIPFSLEDRQYLVVCSNQSLSIYAYNLDTQEYWIAQHLQLRYGCAALAVLDTGRDLLLAIAQLNETHVYAYNPREFVSDTGLHLQRRHTLESPEIKHISAFQMGGRSYLALGGQRPQILLYVQGQLLPKTILGQNFGLVELFLPVPVRTYRDDLLLLVQHRVSFDTHAVIVLETLVWNGEAFEASVPAPCELGTQIVHGVGCMLDVEREAGLRGAALLRQAELPLLLVPRHKAESGLFRLHTELLPRNSELHDLQEIYKFMQDWVSEQDELVQLAERLLTTPSQTNFAIEQVTTPMLVNNGAALQALHINNVPWTPADTHTNMLHVIQEIRLLQQQLLGDTLPPRAKRQQQLHRYDYEQLDFDAVEVDVLTIDKLNHQPFYVQNGSLVFNGTLNVQQLELLQAPAVRRSREAKDTSSSAAVIPLLDLAEDLSCEYINGIPWKQLQQQLVWRNQPFGLSKLDVEGEIIFEQTLEISTLNQLSFPNDYLWSQGNSTSIVQATKQFTQTLSVNSVDTLGTINGVNPLDAITLSDEQDWPGLVTFTQLEISEEFNLTGSAQGRQVEEAPLNPTLAESQHILAACHFAHLIINGPIVLRGQLENDSFDTLIGDIAQRPLDANLELPIPSAKRFANLTLPVDTHVLDGAINGIPIEHFVTKHTRQTLNNLSSLTGYVYFDNLWLSGSYDGINLQQLLSEALCIDAPLLASTTQLHFEQSEQLQLLPNASLHIANSLNDLELSQHYQTLDEPLHLSTASFEQLAANVIDVAHDITGNGRFNGYNLSELLVSPRLTGNVYVEELILPQGVQAANLHGLNAELLLNFLQQLDELPLLILAGQVQVSRIKVSGDVQLLNQLNGQSLEQLQQQVVWLSRTNQLRTRWSFEQPPIFAGNLNVLGTYNERLLPELLADIVFRSAEPITIVAPKSFLQPMRVLRSLQLDALNGVPFHRLANKVHPNEFAGTLKIAGNLYVQQLQLKGKLNGQDWQQVQQLLRYDASTGAFIQRGLITMPQQRKLQDITVLGHFGNRSELPLAQFFEELLYKRQPLVQLQGHQTFTGRVSITEGAHIGELNGLQLKELLPRLIFIDSGAEPVMLHAPVRFQSDVQLQELSVSQLVLEQAQLNGCNVTEWLQETVRVDQPWQAEQRLSFEPGALDNNALQVNYVNDLELSRVITLHTEQNISKLLFFEDLHLTGDLHVNGLVNKVDLYQEYTNTLMINAPQNQRVQTPLIMSSLYVNGMLNATMPINGDVNQNLSNVASLCESHLHLESPLYFAALYAPHLHTEHHISGFNFGAWHERSLWAQKRPVQLITGNWSVRNLRVKQPDASYEAHSLYRRQISKEQQSYQELCERFASVFRWLHLSYHVKSLERRFTLQQTAQQGDIRRIFALAAHKDNYLLINEQGCWTRVYRWNGTSYAHVGAFESGPVDDVAALQLPKAATEPWQFYFMTSYELDAHEDYKRWNCSGLAQLQTWRGASQLIEALTLPPKMLKRLHRQRQAQQQQPLLSYQQDIRYLKRPNTESILSTRLLQRQQLSYADYHVHLERLLQELSYRLDTEVNITQLSIPESDLYDAQLVEDFIELMHRLQKQQRLVYQLTDLTPEQLPLPNNPARVLAARSVQHIWPAIMELDALHEQLNEDDKEAHQLYLALKQSLGSSVHDVLLLANTEQQQNDNTRQLHDVIARLRQLQQQMQRLMPTPPKETMSTAASSASSLIWNTTHITRRPVSTLRLCVGAYKCATVLYARLTIVGTPALAPSSAPTALIQLHYANGTLFQSLATKHTARQLTALRVRDETLFAFVEGCCHIRVYIYRGVEGFVAFAQFQAESEVMELISVRLPLTRPPGRLYALGVAQARQVTFYELLVVGLFEPWIKCT